MSSRVSEEKVNTDLREFSHDEPDPLEEVEFRKKEKALVRKLDCYVAPVMMLLMLISYLDRGNIGFAATQGMTKDLHLKGTDLNVSNFILPKRTIC